MPLVDVEHRGRACLPYPSVRVMTTFVTIGLFLAACVLFLVNGVRK